jgi:hypothetical protein
MRLAWLAFTAPAFAVACAESVPQSALHRCDLGVADGNDGYVVRQGAACRIVAQALAADDKPTPAVSFARKACDLQDPAGCVLYLTLARGQPTELTRARATGEKACDGMVVSSDGSDARPRLCFLAAELYDELEPRSADEAGRLYGRACKLGDDRACPRARALGVDPDAKPPAPTTNAKAAPPPPAKPSMPAPTAAAPTSTVVTQVVAPACHALRSCVQLDLQQRNVSEVVGTMTNHCDHAVACRWCPSKGTDIERSLCHSGTLQPGETRTGQAWGLWYDGFNAMAYDCIGDGDPPGCSAL